MNKFSRKIRYSIAFILLITSFLSFNNISFAATEQIIFHHTDALSGTSIDTDANGNIIEAVDYYPFGEIRIDQKTTTYENKHKFTGKEFDKSDNLYYYGARYYDPSIGRFISADTADGDLLNPQSLNKYSYVMNNPLKYVDPTGEFLVLAAIPLISLTEMAIDAVMIAFGAYLMQSNNDFSSGIITDLTPPSVDSNNTYTTPSYTGDTYNVESIPVTTESFGLLTNIPPYINPQYVESFPDNSNLWTKGSNIMMKNLPKAPKTHNYLPDPNATSPHTVLGQKNSTYGRYNTPYTYTQGATFDANGNFLGRTDVTDHHRDNHSNPHYHPAISPNGTERVGYNVHEYWDKFSSIWNGIFK